VSIDRDEHYWLRAANTMLQAQLDGLQYELEPEKGTFYFFLTRAAAFV
jgi:hypothetical protein